MLTKTSTHVYRCPHCQGESLRKNGHTCGGAQRAFCRDCKRTFVLEPREPRYSAAEREKILAAATQERLSLRAIERTFGPVYRTVSRWAKKKGRGAAGLGPDAFARAEG